MLAYLLFGIVFLVVGYIALIIIRSSVVISSTIVLCLSSFIFPPIAPLCAWLLYIIYKKRMYG